MSKLTWKQTCIIFKAKTQMIKAENNYKNAYNDLKCRICKNPNTRPRKVPWHPP